MTTAATGSARSMAGTTSPRSRRPAASTSPELTAVSGEIVVAGLAWAGDRGIRRVEVSLDGGAPGSRPPSGASWRAAWRQWRLAAAAGASGRRSIKVRAVDGRGDLQTARQAPPIPRGAAVTTRSTWYPA